MKLKIVNAQEVKRETYRDLYYWNVISIGQPPEGWPEIIKARDLIRLGFHDLDYSFFLYKDWKEIVKKNKYILPTKEEIKKGLDFGRKYWEGPLLIHCSAGVSRSPAMAWLILYDKFRDVNFATDYLYRIKSSIHPNTYVIELGLEILIKNKAEKFAVFNELLKNQIWIDNHTASKIQNVL